LVGRRWLNPGWVWPEVKQDGRECLGAVRFVSHLRGLSTGGPWR
jgi:hypothetical protein